MSILSLTIPVSPDQLEAIADHLFEGKELGMLPDERAWMRAHARKKYWGCKILAADLDIEEGTWVLTLETAR